MRWWARGAGLGAMGTLVGRAWVPGDPPGPSVVALRGDGVYDISTSTATMSDLCNAADPVRAAAASGTNIGSIEAVLANSAHDAHDPSLPWFLAPVDLQTVKASGVSKPAVVSVFIRIVFSSELRRQLWPMRGHP